MAPCSALLLFGHDEAAKDVRRMDREPATDLRIEGHDGDWAAIASQRLPHRPAKRADDPAGRLYFDQKRYASADQRQYLGQGRDRLSRPAQSHAAQVSQGALRHPAGRTRLPPKVIIVKNDGLAVPARLNIELYALVPGNGRLEGGTTVLYPPVAMKPAVGEGAGDQPGERGISRP